MASTVPVKSQPLHNFVLPLWKNNNTSRGRSSASSAGTTTSTDKLTSAADPFTSHQRKSQSQSQSPLRHSQSPMRQSPMSEPLRRPAPMREALLRQSPQRESQRQSPIHCGDKGSEPEAPLLRQTTVESKRHPRSSSKNGVYSPDHDRIIRKSETKLKPLDPDHPLSSNNKESRSKLLIKIPAGPRKRSNDSGQEEGNQGKSSNNKGQEENLLITEEPKAAEIQGGEDDEPVAKTWNLRPRKPVGKSLNVNGGVGGLKGAGGGSSSQENKPQSQQANLDNGKRKKVEGEVNRSEKEKGMRYSIPLSKEEIEEDIYALTGSKPSRRPKKRAKGVQKQLDNLFPALWLGPITADMYKVKENAMKG